MYVLAVKSKFVFLWPINHCQIHCSFIFRNQASVFGQPRETRAGLQHEIRGNIDYMLSFHIVFRLNEAIMYVPLAMAEIKYIISKVIVAEHNKMAIYFAG